MHESMERLHKVSGLIRKKEIAEKMGVAQSSVTNWSTRGLSQKAALQAARIWGVDANYLMTGVDGLSSSRSLVNSGDMVGVSVDQMPILSSITVTDINQAASSNSIIGWIEKPIRLSEKSFVFLVIGSDFSWVFQDGDYLYIETEFDIGDLRNRNYLLLIHKKTGKTVIRQAGANVGGGHNMLVTETRSDGSMSIDDFDNYEFIGVIDSRLTIYR